MLGLSAQISQGHEAPEFIAEIHAEMKRRSDEGSAGDPPIYRFVHGLQKFRKLRHEEDFSFGGDDKFADCAIAAHADFIITSDQHFNVLIGSGYKPRPITPEEFIAQHLAGDTAP